eukprot:271524-Prorocentrum_lima.AAC.1
MQGRFAASSLGSPQPTRARTPVVEPISAQQLLLAVPEDMASKAIVYETLNVMHGNKSYMRHSAR